MPTAQTKDEVPKPTGQLQIGIKKRVNDCARKATKGDSLHIHYNGYLKANGEEFDNSYKRGQPVLFTLGTGQESVLEKRKLVVPAHLAYGDDGAPPTIPPDSILTFEIEAVKIDDAKSEL
ncbi:Peptidyl-prolyl cis-trans isomerase FKBP2, partial [Fragariocoptes setiger]